MKLRVATTGDLPSIARLHRVAYSRDHFLALLSEELLADYYSRFLDDGSQIVLAVRPSGQSTSSQVDELLGFAVFGRNIESRIATFKRERRWAIVGTALRNPLLAARKVWATRRGQQGGQLPHVPAPALLLSIAVGSVGTGTGSALLQDMIRRSTSAGERRIGLYVRYSNLAAINAYLRVGFRVVTLIADQYYMEQMLLPGKEETGSNAR